MSAATSALEPPFAVVDRRALQANAAALVRRAAGKPVRVASKSVRCREITRAVLALPGYRGVLALTLPEALWLADGADGLADDVVVAYPSVHRAALHRLGNDEALAARVTIMIDSVEQLALVEDAAGPGGPPIRVCLELDASLRLLHGRVHLGPRRSPVHEVREAEALARAIVARPRFRLVGMMSYEGQVAGVADNAGSFAGRLQIRGMQRMSLHELAGRRAEVVAAVRRIAPLEFVNGGGTGSIE
ncbi:MAG: amino acid deaminase/aldolase, partial [Jatrophihabitans sp.]